MVSFLHTSFQDKQDSSDNVLLTCSTELFSSKNLFFNFCTQVTGRERFCLFQVKDFKSVTHSFFAQETVLSLFIHTQENPHDNNKKFLIATMEN